MLPLFLAAALATAQPTACPSDLLVTNPRLKVVKALQPGLNNYVVTVDVKNQGTMAQRSDIREHLDLLINGKASGTQPIPGLGANEIYAAAFRFQLPRKKPATPVVATFRFVMDDKARAGENCTTANDTVTTKL